MTTRVRTSVTIEKELLRQAKVAAAANNRSLSDLVEEGLRNVVTRPKRRFSMPIFERDEGLAPGIDPAELDKPWDLIDRLDREAAAERSGDLSA